jgi:hypothetical protein
VLLVIDSLDGGGAERYVVDLAIALRSRGWDVEVACSAAGVRAARLRASDVPVNVLAGSPVKRRLSLRYVRALRRLLAQCRYAVVHAQLYASAVKKNQPGLYAQLKNLPWRQIPAAAIQRDRGHGRQEHRTLKAATVTAGLCFPYAMQALRVTRRIRPLAGGKWRTATIYAVTSWTVSQATPAQLAGWIRGHWRIEALENIRDVTYGERLPDPDRQRTPGHGHIQVTSPSGL